MGKDLVKKKRKNLLKKKWGEDAQHFVTDPHLVEKSPAYPHLSLPLFIMG